MDFIVKNYSNIGYFLFANFIYINIVVFLVLYGLRLKEKITKTKALILVTIFVLISPIIIFLAMLLLGSTRLFFNNFNIIFYNISTPGYIYVVISSVVFYLLAFFYWRFDRKSSLKFALAVLLIMIVSLSVYVFYKKVFLKYDCSRQNGRWQAGLYENYCNMPTTDAGQPCINNNQCESKYCAPNEPRDGSLHCYEFKNPHAVN